LRDELLALKALRVEADATHARIQPGRSAWRLTKTTQLKEKAVFGVAVTVHNPFFV
jgi:hypothetical protein